MPQADWVFAVDGAGFEREVIDKSHEVPVVVDFWAPWCGPCRMLAPILERLVNERQGQVLLAKVNIDDEQALAYQFGIESIPAVIGFRGGQPVRDFVGLLPEAQIRAFLDSLGPSEAEQIAQKAATVEETNPAEAEAAYRQALEQDRNQESAQLGLARVLMKQGKNAEARETLENITGEEGERLSAQLFLNELGQQFGAEAGARQCVQAGPKNAQALYELGVIRAAAGKYQDALESLLTAAELDPKLAAAKIREAMVKIFQVIGVRSPLADEYRNKLSALLY